MTREQVIAKLSEMGCPYKSVRMTECENCMRDAGRIIDVLMEMENQPKYPQMTVGELIHKLQTTFNVDDKFRFLVDCPDQHVSRIQIYNYDFTHHISLHYKVNE